MNRNVRNLLDNDRAVTMALRSLSRPVSPAGMTTALRVIASRERERERVLNKRTWRTVLNSWLDQARLAMDNVMRPLAVPIAGGVFSAVALFNMWVVPAYPVLADSSKVATDVPLNLTTEARVKGFSAIGTAGGDVVVDLILDDRGRMVDYQIVSVGYKPNAATRRNLENLLVFSTFVPATAFGKPTSGKMRLFLSSSRIDVKG